MLQSLKLNKTDPGIPVEWWFYPTKETWGTFLLPREVVAGIKCRCFELGASLLCGKAVTSVTVNHLDQSRTTKTVFFKNMSDFPWHWFPQYFFDFSETLYLEVHSIIPWFLCLFIGSGTQASSFSSPVLGERSPASSSGYLCIWANTYT